ncbi:helix-turn-helix domain-containing protein [Streptomyces sp. NPDC005151]
MVRETDGTAGATEPRAALAAEMRRIKEASQLSFGRLADRTHYSRSSWERFLNGKQLPTKVAVEQFAGAAGADPTPLLELLQAAVSEAQKERPTEQEASRAPLSAAEPVRTDQLPPVEVREPEPSLSEPEPEPEPEPLRREPEPPTPQTARAAAVPEWRRTIRTAGLLALGALLGGGATALAIGPVSGQDMQSGWIATRQEPQSALRPQESHPTRSGSADLAEAEPGCRESNCIGREPQSMDCQWDAVTVRSLWLRGMHIQLRYSADCQAVWGRIENGTLGDSVTIKNKWGREQSAVIRVGTDTYTRMLAVSREAPHDTVVICGAIPSQRETECSPLATVQP